MLRFNSKMTENSQDLPKKFPKSTTKFKDFSKTFKDNCHLQGLEFASFKFKHFQGRGGTIPHLSPH